MRNERKGKTETTISPFDQFVDKGECEGPTLVTKVVTVPGLPRRLVQLWLSWESAVQSAPLDTGGLVCVGRGGREKEWI